MRQTFAKNNSSTIQQIFLYLIMSVIVVLVIQSILHVDIAALEGLEEDII